MLGYASGVALSLKPRHLSRYGDIAHLLLKHGRAAGLRDADRATTEDAEKLAQDLESRGPTFVKLGQLLSTRSDLLPDVYLEALARLQDDVAPISYADVEAVVEQELGVDLSTAFRSFDERPLASASIGQVHRAVLRDGQRVAVKVQRPGAAEQVRDDMAVIEELAEFVDAHSKAGHQFGFAPMVEEFRAAITAELDYTMEADNLRALHEHLADYECIVVPRPIDSYTTSRVLTMEYVAGRNISAVSPVVLTDVDGPHLADQLFRAYLDQILIHGFVHADPHPGNVLLTDDHRLALIDLGMVTRLDPATQDLIVRLLIAVSEGRGADAADVLIDLAEAPDDYDRSGFVRHVTELVQRHRTTVAGDLEAGRVVGDLARAAGESGLRPPAELTMLAKALLNLDQVATVLASDFDPNATIQDHVGHVMRQKLAQTASPANLVSAAMEAKEFAEKLPSRVNKVMDALARGELTLNIQGIDETELMRGIQKLANRVTTGVIVAALIIGGAMVVRAGYTSLAGVMLVVAALAGVWLVVSSMRHDVPHRRPR